MKWGSAPRIPRQATAALVTGGIAFAQGIAQTGWLQSVATAAIAGGSVLAAGSIVDGSDAAQAADAQASERAANVGTGVADAAQARGPETTEARVAPEALPVDDPKPTEDTTT